MNSLGQEELLETKPIGLFCSSRCSGTLVLHAYDLARGLRRCHIPVIGGFHSPVEKECLELLLRGSQPTILCLARSLQRMRVPTTWQAAVDDGRLLLLSDFPETVRRVTTATTARRNELVAKFATALLVIHAAPGSRTFGLCDQIIPTGKQVFALESPYNAALGRIGATMVSPQEVARLLPGPTVPSAG